MLLMEERLEHDQGLDFTLQGGREHGPIIVTSVEPGMLSIIQNVLLIPTLVPKCQQVTVNAVYMG